VEVLLGGAEAAVAEALFDDLEAAPPARSQEAWAWRRSWIRTRPTRPADFTAGYHMVLRNQPRRDVPVRVACPHAAGVVLAVHAASGPVPAVAVLLV
jgi:hypothetical protein